MRWPVAIIAAGLAVAASSVAWSQGRILKREPPMGHLKPGQVVLVDDGTCGKGRIKQVIGRDHVRVGGRGNVERRRRCIARP